MTAVPENRRRVALHFPLRIGPWAEIVRGIYRYADRHPHWLITLFTEESVSPALATQPDGVIAMVRTKDSARRLARWGGPVVDTAMDIETLPFARVRLDAVAGGRIAAEHLLKLRCRTYAFVGDERTPAGRGTRKGYEAALIQSGEACVAAPTDVAGSPYQVDRDAMRRCVAWVRSLPLPAAIYCAHDALAHRFAEACRLADRRIPEEIALLGSLNDQFLCTASQPALSSVECPLAAVGSEAARVLESMMAGEPMPEKPIEFTPLGVVTRMSTDRTVLADPGLRTALEYIRDHYAERIGVRQIVSRTALSRSTLERRFREAFGHGPLAELMRHRLDHARRLLVQTDLPVKQIARAAGFHDARHFSATFRGKLGITPSDFRQLHQPE